VVEEIVHKAPQRLRWAPHNLVGAWLHHSPMLALVDHRSNLAASEFLHTVAHSFVVHLPSCAEEGPSSTILPLLFFLASTRSPSSNQSSFP
jgi:hypothetical protein